MAAITEAQKKELKAKGFHVAATSVACDKCRQPLTEGIRYTQRGPLKDQTWCSVCATGTTMHEASKRLGEEETRMAKEAKEEKTRKIAGELIPGTAIADLYLFLEDEKKHPLADVKKAIAKHAADKMGRIRTLGAKGKKSGKWAVLIDDEAGTVQMKLGKGAVSAAAPAAKAKAKDEEPEVKDAATKVAKKVKKEKKVKEAKVEEPEEEPAQEEEEPTVDPDVPEDDEEDEEDDDSGEPKDPAGKQSKGQASVGKLIRKTLGSKKAYTKDVLLQTMENTHGIDAKRASSALKDEMELGGITEEEDGVLVLQ